MRTALPLFLCLLAAFVCGCAPVPLEKPPELPADKRAALGRVCAAAALFDPQELLKMPLAKGKGAATGLAAGAAAGAASGAYMSLLMGPFAPFFVVPFSAAGGIVGAGAGAAVGVVEGVSVDEIRMAGPVIEKALKEEKTQKAMLRAFLDEAALRGFRVDELEGAGPLSPSGEASYSSAAGTADTVVEVSLIDFSLFGEEAFNPPLSLLVNARTKVVRTSDNAVLYERVSRCQSLARQFTTWAADDARLVREDADLCRKAISRNIVRAVFGPGR